MPIAGLLFSLLLLFASCQKKSSISPLKILNQMSSPISHFDPQLGTDLSSQLFLAKSYEALMETHPYDGPYKAIPNLALDYPSLSKDGLVYVFKLRENVLYHPNRCFGEAQTRAVSAHDFVTTFKRIADPHLVSPYYSYWAKRIEGLSEWYEQNRKNPATDYKLDLKGVRAVDALTLEIRIKNPNLYFLNELTTPATAPLPHEALAYYKNSLALNIMGTGPFILHHSSEQNRYEFMKNAHFRKKLFPPSEKFDDPSAVGKALPFLDKIIVHVINEQQTAWLNFINGNVDFIEIPKDNFDSSITAHKDLSPELLSKGIKLGVTDSSNNLYYFGINNKHPLLKNPVLRKAMALALDKDKFNQLFFNGTAQVAQSILPPGIPGNTPPLSSPYAKSNLDLARKALALTGYKQETITLSVRDTTLARQIGEFFQREMQKIGLNIKLEVLSFGALLQKAQKGQAEIFYLAWFVGIPTGLEFFDLLYGKNWPDSFNRFGYTNGKFDRLYEQARQAPDIQKQGHLFAKLNIMAIEDMPILPLVHARDFFVHQAWLKNYVPSETAMGVEQYFDIDKTAEQKYRK